MRNCYWCKYFIINAKSYIPAIGMRNNLNGNHFLQDLVSYNLVHILLLLLFSADKIILSLK